MTFNINVSTKGMVKAIGTLALLGLSFYMTKKAAAEEKKKREAFEKHIESDIEHKKLDVSRSKAVAKAIETGIDSDDLTKATDILVDLENAITLAKDSYSIKKYDDAIRHYDVFLEALNESNVNNIRGTIYHNWAQMTYWRKDKEDKENKKNEDNRAKMMADAVRSLKDVVSVEVKK